MRAPEPRRPARRLAAVLLAAVLLAVPASARGNMAEPYTGPARAGHAAGEPSGGLRQVFIERERLHIDLRPLADDRPARVEAVYRLRNDGPARALDLVFVAAALAAGEHGVWVDGRPVASVRDTAGALPPSWRVPAATPALGSDAPLAYQVEGEGTLSFRVALAPGRHEIRVRYPATSSTWVDEDEITAAQQLAYVLAPARDWAGFGGVDVRVDVPRGWRAAAEPELRREGDALVGSWDRVPADALALTVRPRDPNPTPYWGGWLLLAALGLYLLVRAGRWFGADLGRRGKGAWLALFLGVPLSVAWSVAVTLGLAIVPEMVRNAAGPYSNSGYGYGLVFFGVLLLPALLVVGTAAVQVAAVRARRRALAAAEPAAPAPLPAETVG
ncbi:MAG TPA: hypothetical protein VF615_13345 [Longimicrobiaceae bacterium]